MAPRPERHPRGPRAYRSVEVEHFGNVLDQRLVDAFAMPALLLVGASSLQLEHDFLALFGP